MGEAEEFNTLAFEKKLTQLKDTQESIQSLSSWCLQQRSHHKKIVASWLNVLKRVKVEQRLVLFYLANDVIQYSKRKNYEFVDSWGLNLQKATPLVRDEKVRPKILRIFKIWEQRSVYDEEFLSDLTGLLSAGAIKKTDEDSLDFQPQQLINKIKQCVVLESDTDLRLKYIHESNLQLSDTDALCANLKERSLKDDVEKELNEGIGCVERYTQALQREIVAREALLALLNSASQYYFTQLGEVKVVAYAYKSFGTRVRTLKRKLDDMIPVLPNAAPSPPQRDEDVPSPGPDEDLELPAPESTDDDDLAYNIDQTFNTTLGADGSLYNMGLSSFLTSDNPMALFNDSGESVNNSNKIEVINTRPTEKQDLNFIINDFLKTLTPTENNNPVLDSVAVVSAPLSQKHQDTLPGLDLLTSESTGNPPPPTSFYGTMNNIIDPDQPYHPETSSPWTTNTWNATPSAAPAPVPVPVAAVFAEPPESPPRLPHPPPAPKTPTFPQEMPPVTDVDHRGLLPPPPPPPVLPLLGNIEDVDHRLLSAPSPPITPSTPRHQSVHQDVDHRNLIALTQEPRTPVPRPMKPATLDQDYRIPPIVTPSDIVESVDMDLSEDEEQQGMYQNQQQNQNEHPRRHSFNNNKVLVGGDNGKRVHTEHKHANLIHINKTVENEPPHSAPIIPQMVNPFEVMPPMLQKFNEQTTFPTPYQKRDFDAPSESADNRVFDEDPRRRRIIDNHSSVHPVDNMQLSSPDFKEFSNSSEWTDSHPRPFVNQRFPRNWGPRTNFRPQGFGQHQFWPRNGPRPPNRWSGPRPQRFW